MAKPESRITQVIKFNLYDRGWKHNGKDRSNYDVPGIIRKLNSPMIQEQVEAGKLNGFCGHQIRERYGMIPPEFDVIGGKKVLLEPGIRTVYLKAHENGDVEHRQEFYRNETGDHIFRQYKAEQGGFSMSMNYFIDVDTLRPNIFGGFDYVFVQNFLDNACIGLFDSANSLEVMPVIHQMLENQIVAMFDNIHDSNQTHDYLEAQAKKNRELESKLRRIEARNARREQKAQQLVADVFDSALCADMIPFDQAFSDAESFLSFQAEKEEKQPNKVEKDADRFLNGLGKITGYK